jgi:cell wall-associated NlpC family hydrolase
MASMRPAAAFRFAAFAGFALACCASSALASPLIAPDPPTIAVPAVSLDVSSKGGPFEHASPMASRSPRRVLADFAMKLRNIAYVRGGRELATGFDCSGFVRYVFRQSLGLDLPSNSTSQFATGQHVDRDELRMGDLVFFRIRGKRVSHVGIYLDNGLFIHSPSHGKRVRIDHLDASYWSRRFAGAKRPDALG